jgi:hypothetical protein
MKNIIRKILFFAVAGMFLSFSGTARKITITVQSGDYERENCVVSANVSLLKLSASSLVVLYEQNSCRFGWSEDRLCVLYG